MTLAAFTCSDLIIPALQGNGAATVPRELSEALVSEGRILDLLPSHPHSK